MKISEERFKSLVAGTATGLTIQERLVRQHIAYAVRYGLDPLVIVEARMPDVSIARRDPHAIRPRIDRGAYIVQARAPATKPFEISNNEDPGDRQVEVLSQVSENPNQNVALSPTLVEFSARHGIPIDRFFDAAGMKLAEYAARMEAVGALVAYNVTPCAKSGHSVRNRYGKCVACDPRQLGFNQRAGKAGFVYAAFSPSKGLVKIGFTQNVLRRHSTLVNHRYAGAHDWEVFYQREASEAGRVEINAQKALSAYAVSGLSYIWDGRPQTAKEVFSCTKAVAVKVIDRECGASRKTGSKKAPL